MAKNKVRKSIFNVWYKEFKTEHKRQPTLEQAYNAGRNSVSIADPEWEVTKAIMGL